MNNFLRALFLLVCLALPLMAEPIKAKVKSVEGDVTYTPPNTGISKPLGTNMELDPGTVVKTGPGSSAIIVTLPGVAINVEPSSEVTLTEMLYADNAGASGANPAFRKGTIQLRSGTVSALINKEISKQVDFKVKTPHGVAAARGTFYAVTVKDDKTYVGVKHGRVGVDALKTAANP